MNSEITFNRHNQFRNKNTMLEIVKILNPLYKHTYGKIHINISMMIYIIKKRAYTLGIQKQQLIQTYQVLDLFTAMNILLDEVYQVDYYLYREIKKCLILIDDFFDTHKNIQTKNQKESIDSLYKIKGASL